MKRYISILALLLASQLYPQSKMDINNLLVRDSLSYAPYDDKPYSGGPGMVMQVEPLMKAIEAIKNDVSRKSY